MKLYFYNPVHYSSFTDAYEHGAIYSTGSDIDALADDHQAAMLDIESCLIAQVKCLGLEYAPVVGVLVNKRFVTLEKYIG